MKKKVRMTCVLKSGVVVEDTIKISKKDTKAIRAINGMRDGLEKSMGRSEPVLQNFTFGQTTVLVSDVAAITFKEV